MYRNVSRVIHKDMSGNIIIKNIYKEVVFSKFRKNHRYFLRYHKYTLKPVALYDDYWRSEI